MSAILRMFKVPSHSALFNPAITDSFDAAPSPSAESPYRRASGVLSHALKSCDSVKGSLWQGVSRTHTLLSLAGMHFFFYWNEPERKKNKRERVTSRCFTSSGFLEKLLFKIQPSIMSSRRMRMLFKLKPSTVFRCPRGNSVCSESTPLVCFLAVRPCWAAQVSLPAAVVHTMLLHLSDFIKGCESTDCPDVHSEISAFGIWYYWPADIISQWRHHKNIGKLLSDFKCTFFCFLTICEDVE